MKPIGLVRGKPALLCVLIGHVWKGRRCTRPGCKTRLWP